MTLRPIRTLLVALVALSLEPAAAVAQGTIEYYHLDAIGNVRVVTDAASAVLERHDYLPFGEECTTGPCASNPGVGAGQARKFTGKERDVESGLDYFGARYYGSKIGRFTGVDPALDQKAALVNPQRWNRYAYVSNNPLRFVDPDGREQAVIMGGKTYMAGVDGLPAGNERAKNIVFGALIAGTAGVAVGIAAPELLTAAAIKAADPGTQAAVQEVLQEAAGGPPGAPSPMRIGQGIAISTRGLQHVIERHTVGGARSLGKSIFAEGEDLTTLIKGADGVTPVLQPNGRLERVVEAGRTIGIDRATGKATSAYTVITDRVNNLVTAFPGRP